MRLLLILISLWAVHRIGYSIEPYTEPEVSDADRNHWAFQPIVPKRAASIDALILQRLRSAGLTGFAPRAEDSTLLRRLCLTLSGLPPTESELQDFRYSDLITKAAQLLSSPRYGERWAQHWLDVARFAETDGFEHDKIRPESWRYRDWVINALNRDLPFDQFVARQIAGDELAPATDAALATGFLFGGPDMPDINLEEERRHNVLNEAASTLGAAFLGLTIGCAQCHDHKDDPVSQADFYRLRAFFDNAKLPPKNKSLPHLFQEKGAALTQASALWIRGDFRRKGINLEPAFIRVLNPTDEKPKFAALSQSSGRRSALAAWMIDPEKNPLLARVIVNRVWQHHFGRGLVATPNDFGTLGDRPTHPELLDWLAADLIESGWSLKDLHKQIILSRAWQQLSHPAKENEKDWQSRKKHDPKNRLLSRRTAIRLSGEAIRDGMLAASGDLNLKTGGPGVRPPLPAEVTVTLLKNQWPVTEDEAEHRRRSIYLFARRNLRYPFFAAFDRPEANMSCARRHVSTTAPQSLILLNSRFSDERSARLAEVLEKEESSLERQIISAYVRTVSRVPDADEIAQAKRFIETESLAAFCLALFNHNEFVFLD